MIEDAAILVLSIALLVAIAGLVYLAKESLAIANEREEMMTERDTTKIDAANASTRTVDAERAAAQSRSDAQQQAEHARLVAVATNDQPRVADDTGSGGGTGDRSLSTSIASNPPRP